MALIPFADQMLIPPGPNDPAIIPIGVILHVDAGNNPSLYDFFKNRSGGIESHGHIRKDGDLEQYRDTEREADANYKANSFIKQGKRYGFNSFETQGFGEGEWTDQQISTIKQVLLWENKTHNVPLVVAPGPTEPGVGYHTLYPKDWSPVAKSCPGPQRIEQFNDIIVPWMKKQGVKKQGTLGVAYQEEIKDLIKIYRNKKKRYGADDPLVMALEKDINRMRRRLARFS